jgi:hypothetical protein
MTMFTSMMDPLTHIIVLPEGLTCLLRAEALVPDYVGHGRLPRHTNIHDETPMMPHRCGQCAYVMMSYRPLFTFSDASPLLFVLIEHEIVDKLADTVTTLR